MKPLFTDIEEEFAKSAELEKLLIENGSLCTSSSPNERTRRRVVDTLETLAIKWVRERHHPNADEVSIADPTIITFGSYSLRVHRRDSDIDALCLFDKNISREMFFSGFVDFLSNESSVTQLLAVENAFTPVIKFVLDGIHVDLVFARVSDSTKLNSFHKSHRLQPSPSIITNDTTEDARREYKIDDSDLVGMDEAGVRSLNGVRVTQFVAQAIRKVGSFRTCLCAIKDWAISQGIYSNQMGFLGGINFAILLTRVCMEFPESESWPASVLFKQFFRTFALWQWPQPVVLVDYINGHTLPGIPQIEVWDQSPRDVMPIITPVYPESEYQRITADCFPVSEL